MAIKIRLRRVDLDVQPGVIAQAPLPTGFVGMPVRWPAAALVADLPLHHRDPFNRIIAVETMIGKAPPYTMDAKLRGYPPLVRVV